MGKGTKRKAPGVGIDFKRAKHKVRRRSLAAHSRAGFAHMAMQHAVTIDLDKEILMIMWQRASRWHAHSTLQWMGESLVAAEGLGRNLLHVYRASAPLMYHCLFYRRSAGGQGAAAGAE